MKRILATTFHFLGSVHFAVTLIGVTAIFVTAGTLLESKTASHQFAAAYIYSHPAFSALLCFFFINILFAALRRWPFRFKHIPFLITHLGLLMVIAGVVVKQTFGVQGSMRISEGSGSHELLVEGTDTINIEKRVPGKEHEKFSGVFDLKKKESPFPELRIDLLSYAPHSEEKIETWIKGNHGKISGLPTFPVFCWKEHMHPVPVSGKVRLFPEPHDPWDLFALKVVSTVEAVENIYKEGLSVVIVRASDGEVLFEGKFGDKIVWEGGQAEASIRLNFTPRSGFENPEIAFRLSDNSDQTSYRVSIPLDGSDALINKNLSPIHVGSVPIRIDLRRTPAVAMLENEDEEATMVAFDPYGRVWSRSYTFENINPLVVYDEGFGGYAALAEIPFSFREEGRKTKEDRLLKHLRAELALAAKDSNTLVPPLKLFYDAAILAGVDFADACLNFLVMWDMCGQWIFPDTLALPENVRKVINHMNWGSVPQGDVNACKWTCLFFSKVDPILKNGDDPLELIRSSQWPLLLPDPGTVETRSLLTRVTRQIFSIGSSLPGTEAPAASGAGLLSGYLRAYGIDLQEISPSYESLAENGESIALESPLTFYHTNRKPLTKVEDNITRVILRFREEDREEVLSLRFDRHGTALKLPILQGRYLVRFQPKTMAVPFHLRLRQARQINYSDSSQPYSFESDLLIQDLKHGATEEKTLSMNQVYETWNGYRFYLANISPSDETAVKKIRLIVNYDPGKYYLTYPGGVILSIGIILLFWFRKR